MCRNEAEQVLLPPASCSKLKFHFLLDWNFARIASSEGYDCVWFIVFAFSLRVIIAAFGWYCEFCWNLFSNLTPFVLNGDGWMWMEISFKLNSCHARIISGLISVRPRCRLSIKRLYQCHITNTPSNQDHHRWHSGLWQIKGWTRHCTAMVSWQLKALFSCTCRSRSKSPTSFSVARSPL